MEDYDELVMCEFCLRPVKRRYTVEQRLDIPYHRSPNTSTFTICMDCKKELDELLSVSHMRTVLRYMDKKNYIAAMKGTPNEAQQQINLKGSASTGKTAEKMCTDELREEETDA